MIYLDNTQDLQEVWVPRNDGIRATRDDCFSTGYDSGYTDGYNDGRMSGVSLQEKDVDIVSEVTEITPDEGYDGMSKVTANAIAYGNNRYSEGFGLGKEEVLSNIVPAQVIMDSDYMDIVAIEPYYGFSELAIDARDYSRKRYNEGRNEVLNHIVQTAVTMGVDIASFEPEDPDYGFSEVTVDATEYGNIKYEEGYIKGQNNVLSEIGATAFTENGVYTPQPDDTAPYGWSSVTVNVPQTGVAINNQTKSVSITANGITDVTYDDEYTGLESVKVNVNVPQTGGTGKLRVADYPGMKFGYNTWTEVPDYLNFEGVTDMSRMLYYSMSLTGNVSFNMSGVTNMEGFLQGSNKINSVVLSNTDDVVNMAYAFFSCRNAISITISDTSKVTDFESSFYWCVNLKKISLNVESVEDTLDMFNDCDNIEEIHLTSFLKNARMIRTFYKCTSLSILTVTAWPDADMSRINLDQSPLTHDSIVGLLNALPRASGNYSFQIGQTNIDKLTEEEVAIATNKGWTLV